MSAGLKDESMSVPVLEGQSIGEKETETEGARPEVRRWRQQKSDDTLREMKEAPLFGMHTSRTVALGVVRTA